MAHRDNISRVYKDIHEDDKSVVSVETTTGLWSGDTSSLSTFYTSGTQLAKEGGAKYFVDIYNADPATTSSAEVQFSISYGHVSGAGSPTLTQQNTSTQSTKAVYMQLKNLLLEPTDAKFSFITAAHTGSGDQIYAISFARSRYKGYVDPGNWEFTLSGSNGHFTFIDDSSQTLGTRRSFAKNGLVFNVATGSLSGTQGSTILGITSSVDPNAGEGFGYFYPQKGIIVLNANVIDSHVGFEPRSDAANRVSKITGSWQAAGALGRGENTSSAVIFVSASDTVAYGVLAGGTNDATPNAPLAPFTSSLQGVSGVYADQYNWHGLYHALVRGADATTLSGVVGSWVAAGGTAAATDEYAPYLARSAEIVSSAHYFLRLNNKEFNYSNNPSFASGSSGQLANADFENDPKVYVTTVGLYNDSNELLAVAKLSRPLEKSFSKEALLRVRLDF